MKLLGFDIHLVKPGLAENSAAPQPLAPACGARSYGEPPDAWTSSLTSDSAAAGLYSQVVWAYRAINVLAEQVANVPFRLTRSGAAGDEPITAGPLAEFYARPIRT